MKYSQTDLTDKLVKSETTDYILNNVTDSYSRSDLALRTFNTIGEVYDELIKIVEELSKQGSIKGTTWLLEDKEKQHKLEHGLLTVDERKERLRNLKYNRKGFTPYRAKQLIKEFTGNVVEIVENVDTGTFEIVFLNPRKLKLKDLDKFDRYKHSELIYRVSSRFRSDIVISSYRAFTNISYEDWEAGTLEAGNEKDNQIKIFESDIVIKTQKNLSKVYPWEAGTLEAGDPNITEYIVDKSVLERSIKKAKK